MFQQREASETSKFQTLAGPTVSLVKILVATDYSDTSSRALEYALSLARQYNSRIFLTHVIPQDLMMDAELTEASKEQARLVARARMEEIVNSGCFFGVSHEQIIEEGTLWPSLNELIKKHGIDLLVVGTHGKGVVQKVLSGSSAEEIFRHARIPVLTVGPSVWREPFYGVEFKNILFATALGLGAERQAAYAFSLAQEHHSRLTLLHVQQRPDEEQSIVHQLRELIPTGVPLHCLPLFRVGYGEPADEIIRVAAETQANLIVIGAQSREGLAGHVPHTKVYRVVCGASCPVLTIKS